MEVFHVGMWKLSSEKQLRRVRDTVSPDERLSLERKTVLLVEGSRGGEQYPSLLRRESFVSHRS